MRKLAGTLRNGPFRFEAQYLPGAREIHSVRARVISGPACDLQPGSGHRVDDGLGDLGDGPIVPLGAHVECHTADRIIRGGEGREDGAGDVRGVCERAPRRAVGEDGHLAGQHRTSDEVVENDVGAQPGGEPERRGVPQRHRSEVAVGKVDQIVLHPYLRDRVGSRRLQWSVLVNELVAGLRSVHGARRGVDEALDAGILR